MNHPTQLFVCFAAEDRYNIAEPIVYHLKNYGIATWYDRHELLLGDNRQKKNLDEGAAKCRYAIVILSKHTINSICAMEELCILEERSARGEVTVFPILYELLPDELSPRVQWVKKLIFKETDCHSGTREICNHIACRITDDIISNCRYKSIHDILEKASSVLPYTTYEIIRSYEGIDCANLNGRIALLYSAYLTLIHSKLICSNPLISMISKIFDRLFSETRLNLAIDYRELWLLENSICILIDCYLTSCIESKI